MHKEELPCWEKSQKWGNVFICARQPVFASIVHLLLPEGKLLSATQPVCTSGLRQMHLMHTTAFKTGGENDAEEIFR